MTNSTKDLLARADHALAEIDKLMNLLHPSDAKQFMAANSHYHLIRDVRNHITGIEKLKDRLRSSKGLGQIDCGCEFDCCCREFSKGMQVTIETVEEYLGPIKLLPPEPQND